MEEGCSPETPLFLLGVDVHPRAYVILYNRCRRMLTVIRAVLQDNWQAGFCNKVLTAMTYVVHKDRETMSRRTLCTA